MSQSLINQGYIPMFSWNGQTKTWVKSKSQSLINQGYIPMFRNMSGKWNGSQWSQSLINQGYIPMKMINSRL